MEKHLNLINYIEIIFPKKDLSLKCSKYIQIEHTMI